MKRISTLLLSAAMLFGAVGAAQATEFKAKGQYDFAFGWAENNNFYANSNDHGDDRNDDSFIAKQRLRTQVNFITSESLQGVVMFEIGNTHWGNKKQGGALDADQTVVEVKRAYLDWIIPSTDIAVRMGIQGLALPSATGLGNPVFNADVAAMTFNYKIYDMFSITSFWARPFDASTKDDTTNKHGADDEADLFGGVLNVTGDGWALTPWGVYGQIGASSGLYDYVHGGSNHAEKISTRGTNNAEAWWLGTGFELTMFDPLTFAMDVMYGDLHKTDLSTVEGVRDDFGTRGWFVDANLNYKLDWATPGLFGWYSSGDSKDGVADGQYGRIPTIGTDGGFAPTTFGMAGSAGIGTDSVVSTTAAGTWGIGIQLADMSFIEDLTHTLRFAYYKGTNDHEVGLAKTISTENLYLTDKDHAFEVNFDHKYQIYENLAAFVELGYINLDIHEDSFAHNDDTDDAWKAQVLFQYKF